VARSDSPVPFRADQVFWPSDLKRHGRPRSVLLELTGEATDGYVGKSGGGLRWSSGGPLQLQSGGQGAAHIGKPGGVLNGDFSFLLRRLWANEGGERLSDSGDRLRLLWCR
jgi:hypothetical protein